MTPPEFLVCEVRPEKKVYFFALIPLFNEEVTLKLRKGSDALLDRFDKYGITDLIDTKRQNVGKKWWQFLG